MSRFAEEEEELRRRLLFMGGIVESMIPLAMQILTERARGPLVELYRREEEVNRLHIELDDRVLTLVARYQPAATDLRLILATTKINSDLERIGDQAVNIGQSAEILLDAPPAERRLLDIPRMHELAASMLHDALDAFARREVGLARSVVARDDEEDRLKAQAFHTLMRMMQADSFAVQRGLGLILIARNFERIADHATNVAEDVIFMVIGKDIRHGATAEGAAGT